MANSCGLKILQWNCNGFLPKLNEFKQHIAVSENSYDVICLQETFLKPDKNFTITGYNIVRKDRTNANKGGLITLIKESLNYSDVEINMALECIVVKIKTHDSYVNIANLYIPPNTDIDSGTITQIFSRKTIIVGDLNSKNTLWGSPLTDVRGDIIENIMNHKNFITLNNGQPTHTHHNGTRTHLDLSLVCNTLAAKSNWEVLNNTFGSDHAPTITHYNDQSINQSINQSWVFRVA